MSYGLSLLALLLALAAVIAWLRAGRLRTQSGLPSGRVFYADTGAWRRPEAPLFSARYQLTGKPDYLVEASGRIVPVEVKSGPAPPRPYRSHRLQLAAYCLLVEEFYRQAPPHGLLRYSDGTVVVEYTAELRDELLAVLQAMRQDACALQVPRSHDHAARCRACGFRAHCGEALA
jgi:CRISPR-associated exonuclease Cas4